MISFLKFETCGYKKVNNIKEFGWGLEIVKSLGVLYYCNQHPQKFSSAHEIVPHITKCTGCSKWIGYISKGASYEMYFDFKNNKI